MFKYFSTLPIPIGLALAIPVEPKKDLAKQESNPLRIVKPSKLPIYENPQDLYSYEYHSRERTQMEEGVSTMRKELLSAYEATVDARESVFNIYETGKAHTLATADYIFDEENVAAKVGAVSVGGLLGLLIGGRRKGFIKKIFYTAVGATGIAGVVYPKEASQISRELYDNAGTYSVVAYNFIAGVKPQIDDSMINTEPSKKTPTVNTLSNEKKSSTPADKSSENKDVVVKIPNNIEALSSSVKGDEGQSNPADKDMYTTRS